MTWEKLKLTASECKDCSVLRHAVITGFPLNKDSWPEEIKGFRSVHIDLTVLDAVVMLQRRIVVPRKVRQEVLRHLHIIHSGINGMLQRAINDVFWPEYTVDIIRTKEQCRPCAVNSPSNPNSIPSQDPQIPDFPFQLICMDCFQLGGK